MLFVAYAVISKARAFFPGRIFKSKYQTPRFSHSNANIWLSRQ